MVAFPEQNNLVYTGVRHLEDWLMMMIKSPVPALVCLSDTQLRWENKSDHYPSVCSHL